MSSGTSAKDKVGSDEVDARLATKEPTSSDGITLEDGEVDKSDSDAEIDMILRTPAVHIKAPEVGKPARRRPWGGVRAPCFSDLGAVETRPQLLPEEVPAKTGQQSSRADGEDDAAESNRTCQSRVLEKRRFLSAPVRPASREHSQRITVAEIRSKLPSLRSEASKQENMCRYLERSRTQSFSDSAGTRLTETTVKYHSETTDPRASRAQYSMMQFVATPTLSTSRDPAKVKRPCYVRKRVTTSGEAATPTLDAKTLAKLEATSQETTDSSEQEAAPSQAFDSLQNKSISEARAALNNCMREALSMRAPSIDYWRRRRPTPR